MSSIDWPVICYLSYNFLKIRDQYKLSGLNPFTSKTQYCLLDNLSHIELVDTKTSYHAHFSERNNEAQINQNQDCHDRLERQNQFEWIAEFCSVRGKISD